MHFQALPSGEQYKCEIGKKPENVPKNRYKTTFPCKFIFYQFFFILNYFYELYL